MFLKLMSVVRVTGTECDVFPYRKKDDANFTLRSSPTVLHVGLRKSVLRNSRNCFKKIYAQLESRTSLKQYKMLSYRRETALQGAL